MVVLSPLVASAQSYPVPTFGSLILQNPLTPANGGTGATSATGTGSVVLSNSPVLTTPNLGTPSAVALTNATGLPVSRIATQAANTVLANVTGSTASPTAFAMPSCSGSNNALRRTSASGFTCASSIALTSGTLAQFAATTSAQLLGVISDETGSGSLVFGTSPTISSPSITGGSADASSAPGPVMDGWQFSHVFGGSTMNGGRQIMDVIGHCTAPSNPANPLPGYVAIAGELITNSGDNGTAPTLANGRGSFFAMNPVVVANSGAQNLLGIAGAEVNVQCNGCSTAIRYGVSSVQNGANQASILANDAAFNVGNQVAGGAWHQALNISNANGQAPLDTTACVICTDSTANTIGTGIDLSAYTISGNFLKGPGGGFVVTGSGATTTYSVTAGNGGVSSGGGLTVSSGGGSIAGGLTVSGGTTSVAALTATGTVSGAGFSSLLAPYAPLASPALTGTPDGPGTGDRDEQYADRDDLVCV